jgi:hypothetical protein
LKSDQANAQATGGTDFNKNQQDGNDLVMEDDQANTQAIGGVDSDITQQDENSEDGEEADDDDDDDDDDDEQGLEVYKHKKHKNNDYESDEDINLGDYENLTFGRDFVEVDGETIHVAEYLGDDYVQRIVSLACVSSHFSE